MVLRSVTDLISPSVRRNVFESLAGNVLSEAGVFDDHVLDTGRDTGHDEVDDLLRTGMEIFEDWFECGVEKIWSRLISVDIMNHWLGGLLIAWTLYLHNSTALSPSLPCNVYPYQLLIRAIDIILVTFIHFFRFLFIPSMSLTTLLG